MKLYPKLSRGRYADQNSEVEAAKRSLYYLWWRFLRLSEDYWWVCRFDGKCKDADLCATYGRFGNVFTDTFEQWWESNGERLFAFKVDPPKVERMDAREIHRSMGQHYEILLVPKYLTKSEITKQVQQVMAEHEPSPLPKQFKYDLSVSDTRRSDIASCPVPSGLYSSSRRRSRSSRPRAFPTWCWPTRSGSSSATASTATSPMPCSFAR